MTVVKVRIDSASTLLEISHFLIVRLCHTACDRFLGSSCNCSLIYSTGGIRSNPVTDLGNKKRRDGVAAARE